MLWGGKLVVWALTRAVCPPHPVSQVLPLRCTEAARLPVGPLVPAQVEGEAQAGWLAPSWGLWGDPGCSCVEASVPIPSPSCPFWKVRGASGNIWGRNK